MSSGIFLYSTQFVSLTEYFSINMERDFLCVWLKGKNTTHLEISDLSLCLECSHCSALGICSSPNVFPLLLVFFFFLLEENCREQHFLRESEYLNKRPLLCAIKQGQCQKNLVISLQRDDSKVAENPI